MSNDTKSESSLREVLTEQYKYVAGLGLNEQSTGNLSIRLDDGMLISPTGATNDTIAPETIVKTMLDGEWEGDRRPSTEWRMHAEVYRQFPKVRAVVHTHSDNCVALSCHNLPLPGFHYLIGLFGGNDVPCVPYFTFGTAGPAAAAALKDRTACLLGNHGMISRGGSLGSAVATALRLEIMCRQYLLSRQLGEPKLLTDKEWDEFFDRASKVGNGTYV